MVGNAIINRVLTGLSNVSTASDELRNRIIHAYGKWVAYEYEGQLRYQRNNVTIASPRENLWVPVVTLDNAIAPIPHMAGDDPDAIIATLDSQFFSED